MKQSELREAVRLRYWELIKQEEGVFENVKEDPERFPLPNTAINALIDVIAPVLPEMLPVTPDES